MWRPSRRTMALVGSPVLALLVIAGTSAIAIRGISERRQTIRQSTPSPSIAARRFTPAPAPPTPAPLPPGNDWAQYRSDLSGSGVNDESIITTANVGQLEPIWSHGGQPAYMGGSAIVAGVVYVANGSALYAYDLRAGTLLWRFDDAPQTHGLISSTVAVDANAHLAFYGTPDARVFAVDIRTGHKVWAATLGDANQGAHIWSSPIIANGKVYIGLASHDDDPCVRGGVFALDESTGRVAWAHYMVPAGTLGGSVWSTVAANPNRHELIITTGNPCPAGPAIAEEDSFVGVNWDTGQTDWTYTVIGYDDCDCDFGEGPVDVTYNGQEYVVGGNKLGYMYGLRLPSGGGQPQLVWSTQIAVSGYYQQGGIFEPPTYANGLVYVGGGPTPDNSCPHGALWAFHVDTGTLAWQVCTSGQVISPSAFTGGVLFVGEDNTFVAYDAASGNVLWHFAYKGQIWGSIAISRGFVVLPVVTGDIYCFTLPRLVSSSRAGPN